MFLRRFKKSKYLRVVNLLGLSVIFACMLLSFAYVRKEFSYDRFHSKADRIVRLSMQFGSDPVDGRIYALNRNSPILTDNPAIEDAVLFQYMNTGILEYEGRSEIVNDFYVATSNFFEIFDFPLLEGDKSHVIDAPEKVVISRRYARQLFGETSPVGKEIRLSGRHFRSSEDTYFISGVFEDFPENSHFHTDLIAHLPDNNDWWVYVYLLLHPGSNIDEIKQTIALKMEKQYANNPQKASPYIMPLTDIHLHSRLLRELEINGNINYIYLIVGANILLLVIVLFNLWLNAGLIFSFNRKYYQLLRLNGASSSVVVRDEALLAFVLGLISLSVGGLIAYFVFPQLDFLSIQTVDEFVLLTVLFLALIVFVSLLPVFSGLSATLFKNFQSNVKPVNFSLDKVKYLLIAQYGIVMFIVIVSFGITKQINLIKTSQVGGDRDSVLVMNEQPQDVVKRYDLLKTELLKHSEIKMVTSAMQLPGSAIRDMISVRTENEGENEGRYLPLLIVGDDFLPFFDIKPIAGTVFQETRRTLEEEEGLFFDMLKNRQVSSLTEEYVINCKAAQMLGFRSPEEAVGKLLHLHHDAGMVNYINNGVIVGVTDDFNYTTTFEDSAPLIVLQRKIFQTCFMVYLSPENQTQALQTFHTVWNQVNPDYPVDYDYLQNLYGRIYYNELNAEMLTRIFSLLCLIVANLGLIIIMAFVIKRKTKEIGIRKVNGATPIHIIRMLNSRFFAWIGVAFVIAVPVSYYAMNYWLQHFSRKTSLDWWVFALSGLLVLLLSVTSISWQSWRAANQNTVKALKTE